MSFFKCGITGDPQGFQWSNPVNVTNYNDQFIRIPYFGDVKVSISATAHTINVLIESVSKVYNFFNYKRI